MNLTTTTQKQIHAVELHGDTCLSSLISFAECLNRAHKDFWDKSDEELQAFLQALLDQGQLIKIFEDHLAYATATNTMLQSYGSAPICNIGIKRQFTVTDGVLSLVAPTVVEI